MSPERGCPAPPAAPVPIPRGHPRAGTSPSPTPFPPSPFWGGGHAVKPPQSTDSRRPWAAASSRRSRGSMVQGLGAERRVRAAGGGRGVWPQGTRLRPPTTHIPAPSHGPAANRSGPFPRGAFPTPGCPPGGAQRTGTLVAGVRHGQHLAMGPASTPSCSLPSRDLDFGVRCPRSWCWGHLGNKAPRGRPCGEEGRGGEAVLLGVYSAAQGARGAEQLLAARQHPQQRGWGRAGEMWWVL